MGWPQITLAILWGVAWVLTLAMHGKPRTGNHDIGVHTAGLALVAWLLWCGGFWGHHQ
jgi:hypothetical protein